MAEFALDDRVKETSTTTGTGTFDLDGAVTNFQTFVAGIGSTNTTHYAIIHRSAAEWETGLGTVTDAAPDTLARTTVITSSNGDAAVNFSAGTKDVICTHLAGRLAGKLLVMAPDVDQNITAAGDTLDSSVSHLEINPDADYLMTATPALTIGEDGQFLTIHNIHATNTITLQDDAVVAGTNVFLGGAEGTIRAGSVMTLHYSASVSGWTVLSNPNSASVGANASTIPVRNSSGSTITAGQMVYITGYSTGQNRMEVGLADADDAAKMPAIGITAAAIGNNANGDVITSGVATNLINTTGTAIGDGVWVSTTAGGVVFTRPAVDNIQRIGTVSRVHASQGVVHIFGAGRANDIPIVNDPIGQQTIWVPAAAMEAAVTTAPAISNAVEIATSLFAARTMDFATDADDFAYFAIQMPKGWDEGTLIVQCVWSATGQGAGNDSVVWAIAAQAYASNDPLTGAFPAPTALTLQEHSATNDDVMITDESSAVTVGGSPAAEEFVAFEVSRDVSADDLDVDARLHGIKIHYTINAGSDN